MAERTSIEQELERHGRGFFQVEGHSMEPLLHNHYTTVVIEKPSGRLKKDDVALFHRPGGTYPCQPEGRYVLHRVLKVRERDYVICGDNSLFREPVPDEWIVGVMTGFYNGDVYTPCDDAEYLRRVKRLNAGYWLRWCRALPKRVKRKLFH